MDILAQIRKPIEEELKRFDETYRSAHSSSFELIQNINSYILERKGKQMRAIMIFLVAKMLGQINDNTYIAGVVLELLHNASLLHDDVVDETMERRGEKSVNAIWSSKEAVLMGDYLLSKGLIMASETNNIEILKIVSNVGKELSEGELLQTGMAHTMNTTEEIYYEIIQKKTAILFSSCSKAAASTIGATKQDVDKMENFGHALGMAFQIKDDVLDYQLHAQIGKPVGNDLRERKLTLPILYLLERISKEEKKGLITHIRQNHQNEVVMNQLITRVVKEGGVTYAKQRMQEYMDEALQILATYPDSNLRTSLIELIFYTIERPK